MTEESLQEQAESVGCVVQFACRIHLPGEFVYQVRLWGGDQGLIADLSVRHIDVKVAERRLFAATEAILSDLGAPGKDD